MTRSPLYYPLNRGGDAEAGGAADLQTDIMRFMAILALCLVAIFALVQSIPLTPPAEPAEPFQEKTRAVAPEPVTARDAASIVVPEETMPPVVDDSGIDAPGVDDRMANETVVARPAAPADKPNPAAWPAPVEPMPEPDKGFTLRFASNRALTKLVARGEVGFYAITGDSAVRMNVSGDSYSFWPASVPNQYHEMDQRTVPASVLAAVRRSGSASDGNITWGVTLPARMRQQLDAYLTEHTGGSLVIGASGAVRLEQ